MASAIASTVSENGSTDVGINGTLARALGVVSAWIAPDRLRVVQALSPADQIPQAASAKLRNLTTSVRNSSNKRLPDSNA